jgi:hypothetical protein
MSAIQPTQFYHPQISREVDILHFSLIMNNEIKKVKTGETWGI